MQLAERIGRLEHGQARVEGLLEGLKEIIFIGLTPRLPPRCSVAARNAAATLGACPMMAGTHVGTVAVLPAIQGIAETSRSLNAFSYAQLDSRRSSPRVDKAAHGRRVSEAGRSN